MRGGVDLRLMARRLPVERGRPLTEAEAEADGRLVGSLLLGVRQRGRREQKERNRDRVETDRHSRSYPPSIGTVRVIGRTAGNRFRSPADLSESIQPSEWPSRLHTWGGHRSFSVTGLDRAGGGLFWLPALHRCASRASLPAPHEQEATAGPQVIRKSKGAMPAPPQAA